MMSLDDALAQLLAHATVLDGIDQVATFDADGRVLAQDLVSPLQVPPQDNSSMDGYALRCADVIDLTRALPVSQRIPAGSAGTPLAPGTVARIFTGAPIPPGADAVVMQEDCEVLADGSVRIKTQPNAGPVDTPRGGGCHARCCRAGKRCALDAGRTWPGRQHWHE